MEKELKEIFEIYKEIKPLIINRLSEFNQIWEKGSEEDIFCELVFCIFTPQSKAKSCSEAVIQLMRKDLIFNGKAEDISKEINIVRFRNNKAKYLVEAREKFTGKKPGLKKLLSAIPDIQDKRDFLLKNIKGIGLKEASHFLRNIGFGSDIAILDRHILKNLKLLQVIDEVPVSLTVKKYLEIESLMLKFSREIGIPPDHLDFVLWYKEAGEVFK